MISNIKVVLQKNFYTDQILHKITYNSMRNRGNYHILTNVQRFTQKFLNDFLCANPPVNVRFFGPEKSPKSVLEKDTFKN